MYDKPVIERAGTCFGMETRRFGFYHKSAFETRRRRNFCNGGNSTPLPDML